MTKTKKYSPLELAMRIARERVLDAAEVWTTYSSHDSLEDQRSDFKLRAEATLAAERLRAASDAYAIAHKAYERSVFAKVLP